MGILAIYFVAGPAIACLKDYEAQLKSGKPITFDPRKLGIKNATFWEQRCDKANAGGQDNVTKAD